MKNYKEVAECVFARSEAIIEQKKQNRKALVRKVSMMLPCFAVVLLVFVISGSCILNIMPSTPNIDLHYVLSVSIKQENPSTTEGASDNINENTHSTDDSNNEKNPNDGNNDFDPDTDNAIVDWKGKNVTSSLAECLKTADKNDVIEIYMRCSIDSNYTYNGKTLLEYINEKASLRVLAEKLETLVKVGDSLKYGEALYTTGTPTGEKWTKENYDNIIAYYGNEIIEKYIVNREFLTSTLSEDTAALYERTEELEAEYKKAYEAYVSYTNNKAKNQLSSQNIQSALSSNGDCLILNISVENFENLHIDDLSIWTFSLKKTSCEDLNDTNTDIQIPQDAVINSNVTTK